MGKKLNNPRVMWCDTCDDFTRHSVTMTSVKQNEVWHLRMCLEHNQLAGLTREEVAKYMKEGFFDWEHTSLPIPDWNHLVKNDYM